MHLVYIYIYICVFDIYIYLFMFNTKYIYTPYSCKDSECSHVAGGDEASVATDPRKPLDSSPDCNL